MVGDLFKKGSTESQAGKGVEARSSSGEVASFLNIAREVASDGGRGRLVFALDATMSRQASWDMAMSLQGDMFRAAAALGGLDVQLVYFRGLDECRASRWVRDANDLVSMMSRIDCRGGQTQIRRVLAHVRDETARRKVNALVFIGDAFEEDIDALSVIAGELRLLGVACFMFQEGHAPDVERCYREIARLSGGAWCRFDAGAAAQLRALLGAVAAYATGGRKALDALTGKGDAGAGLLLQQMR
jgi:hypothetical protein